MTSSLIEIGGTLEEAGREKLSVISIAKGRLPCGRKSKTNVSKTQRSAQSVLISIESDYRELFRCFKVTALSLRKN